MAGFENDKGTNGLLIDSHNQPVPEEVIKLLEVAYQTWGIKPTLLERDGNIPEFNKLLAESHRLQKLQQERYDVIN